MSYLAWIDFDPEERRRAQTLIDLFKQPEARDELGLGTVRDAIADLLFPGTSTIQTRIRYMLFVPWIYLQSHGRVATQAERTAIARNLEFELSEALLRGEETTDVIGRLAGRQLKRLPSSVYWAGLHVLGIRLLPGSQATFLSYGPESLKDHDLKLWSPDLPKPPADLFGKTNFALTEDEAGFLRDRIECNAKHSLLNELARKGKPYAEDWPWQVSAGGVSDANRALLRHAEYFSGVMHGASLLYNLLLAKRAAENPNAKTHADAPALIEGYQSELDAWKQDLAHLSLDEWSLDDIFSSITQTSHNPTGATRNFIQNWVSLAKGASAHIENDDRAIELLKQREHGLKRMKARLIHDAPLERWSGASGSAPLNFRWNIASKYLEELADVS